MPSIRVKGQVYSTLEDTNDDSLRTQPPGGNPRNTLQPYSDTPTRNVQHSFSLPLLPRGILDVPSKSHGRPRSSSSRVYAHCINANSQRSQPSPNPLSNARSTPTLNVDNATISQEIMTIEGALTDVRAPSHVEPGIVESSIDISLTFDNEDSQISGHHHDDVVEHLDVIDSQVGVVSNLTNAANSIMIPSLYFGKPVVILSSRPHLNDGMDQFEHSLDRHVNDVLESPSKLRRTMIGVWSFLKTPLGIITGIYAFLVVFWGAAIVIFLAKIIDFHNANTQGFWVEVSSQVETVMLNITIQSINRLILAFLGLFTVTGIGFIPWRVLDTYRIWRIWQYKRKTIRLRAKAGLPQLFDVDDLPDPLYDPNYVHVLTDTEQKDLHRQQRKFQHSQTWYRAHGTETHRAFPINMALWICLMNDGNSIFQIFLCGTMWGLNRFQRPAWSTGTLIPASFLCGIIAAVLIWRGGESSKRVEEVRSRLLAALAEKHPLDRPLGQNHTGNSRPEVDSQTVMVTNIREKDISHSAISNDKREAVPPAG